MHTQLLPSKWMQFYLHSQHPFLIACLWEPAPASPFASIAEQNREWPFFFLIQIQRKFAYMSGCESSMTSMSLGLWGLWARVLERASPVSVKVFWVARCFCDINAFSGGLWREPGRNCTGLWHWRHEYLCLSEPVPVSFLRPSVPCTETSG